MDIYINSLLNSINYLNKEQQEEVIEAAKFTKSVHKNQKRESGDLYYTHPIEVTKILASFKMSPSVLIAGLLHDVLEDTHITEIEIEKKFGRNVLFFVRSVTKLESIRYIGFDNYINDLQKFFIAASKDVRVLIIKLCDRLHNMRTLEHLPKKNK